MSETLLTVFDRHFEKVKFDGKLARLVYRYHISMSTKNPEHIQFFGGNLLGVNTLRYTPKDVKNFFDQVLDIDYSLLEADIRQLNTIYHGNSISGDILNLTLFYMIHRWYTTPDLNQKARMQSAYDTALIFCYRCTFAMTNNFFKYPADPKVAQAAYANLSNKHLIKRKGSWKKLCEYRATRIVEEKTAKGEPGLNYARLYLFTDDIEVTDMIQDSAGRFKSIFMQYYHEFDLVHKDGKSIGSTSATIKDADGEMVLREKTQGTEVYVAFIRGLINDPSGFIDNDLVTVVADMNGNTSYRMVNETLHWLANAYHDIKYTQAVDKFVTDVVVQGMFYIEHNIPLGRRKDLPYILVTLRNLFLSTRSTDPQLLSIRKQGEKLVYANNRKISSSLMMATRTAIILYIILRALVGQRGR